MALTHARVVEMAQALAATADEVKSMYGRISEVLKHNSHLSIDWAAGSPPAYLTEDAAGNLTGLPYSRQQISNLVGSLEWIRKLLDNEVLTGAQGDHLGNINQVARP